MKDNEHRGYMKYFVVPVMLLIQIISTSAIASAVDKHQLVNELKKHIEEFYVLQQNIPAIMSHLTHFTQSEDFTKAKSASELLPILNTRLQAFDKHLGVSYKPNTQDAMEAKKAPYESWFTQLERKNFGFNRIEILPGNVGVMAFWGFANVTQESKRKVHAIMTLLSDVDSLIIDLRENGGGDAAMVQQISSYFLDKKTHLNSFYSRDTDQTSEYWTVAIEGKKRPSLPIYILTSNATFSAAEEFAYNFKHLGRAIIIGESTKGGANPWRFVDIGDDIRVAMPVAMAINPITNTNWEGKGVQPDHSITADKALEYAYKKALEQLALTQKNPHEMSDIKSALKQTSFKITGENDVSS